MRLEEIQGRRHSLLKVPPPSPSGNTSVVLIVSNAVEIHEVLLVLQCQAPELKDPANNPVFPSPVGMWTTCETRFSVRTREQTG